MTVPSRMAAPSSRRRRRLWMALPIVPAGMVGGSMWWFTAPLEDRPTGHSSAIAPAPPPSIPDPEPASEVAPTWPEGRMEGDDAKRLLLDFLSRAASRLDRLDGYTAVFRKQERINGVLQPEQTMAMKVRNRPFAIYLKFLAPRAGKEVLFAEGHHGDKVIAHNGDWTRRLVPRLAVEPDSALALADSRHPVTEAGLVNLVRKLLGFRKMDLDDSDAVTILDRVDGEGGSVRLRSIHTHTIPNPDRPFVRVEVLYDPETHYPVRISSYDWPAPGQGGEPELAERYIYDDLRFDPAPTAIDFDLTNPDYEFQRF